MQRRPAGRPLASTWEFPGGKVEVGETLQAAVARECREEVGCAVAVVRPLPPIRYRYPHARVTLHPFLCRPLGAAVPREGQRLRWLRPG
ncbi:MAG: (deoxy)nucleoside triphosphate pyrophosphohydrolase, partial [Nitrospirae bacterium]